MNVDQGKRRLVTRLSAGVLGAASLGFVFLVAGTSFSEPPPTFGTIPDAVSEAGEPAQASDLPDYIVAWDREGNLAGYVAAPYVWPVVGREADFWPDGPIPVVDTKLTLVGHMVPGVGFVPLGVDPSSVPPFVVTTVVDGSDDGSG